MEEDRSKFDFASSAMKQTEDQSKHDDILEEEISESFLCCVCLDLLYKPIVLSCGHICCFWCIHKSMDGVSESHCPICRHPYYYFPTICHMLQVMLIKLYPLSYKRRELQTSEEEKNIGVCSPQIGDLASGFCPRKESNNLSNHAHSFTTHVEPNLCPDPGNELYGMPCENTEQSEFNSMSQNNGTTGLNQAHKEHTEGIQVAQLKEGNITQSKPDGNHKHILLNDVLCAACNHMLFHPAVFNCGHVFCETCIILPEKGKLLCQVCLTIHPCGPPRVCLELDHFLENEFPEEYSVRRASVQPKSAGVPSSSSNSTDASKTTAHSSSLPTRENAALWSDLPSNVHFYVGCDFCGMFPIIGDRYNCKDCEEKVGFDLCKECYNTRSQLPGRFNQQHTQEHQFKLVRSSTISNIILRLVTDRSDDDPTASVPSENASENPQNDT